MATIYIFYESQGLECWGVFNVSRSIAISTVTAVPKYTLRPDLVSKTFRNLIVNVPGVPIHWPDGHGWCALHVAILQNNAEMLDYLLSTRTSLNYKNREGWSPLHVAVRKRLLPLVKKLVQVSGN